MSRSMKQWLVAGWAVLALVGGAATLYLEGPATAPAERAYWERVTPPAEHPCPSRGRGTAPDTRRDCTSWTRE